MRVPNYMRRGGPTGQKPGCIAEAPPYKLYPGIGFFGSGWMYDQWVCTVFQPVSV
jgi:hypothetical protein